MMDCARSSPCFSTHCLQFLSVLLPYISRYPLCGGELTCSTMSFVFHVLLVFGNIVLAHVIKRIWCIVGFVYNSVVLVISLDDSLGGGAYHYYRVWGAWCPILQYKSHKLAQLGIMAPVGILYKDILTSSNLIIPQRLTLIFWASSHEIPSRIFDWGPAVIFSV